MSWYQTWEIFVEYYWISSFMLGLSVPDLAVSMIFLDQQSKETFLFLMLEIYRDAEIGGLQ